MIMDLPMNIITTTIIFICYGAVSLTCKNILIKNRRGIGGLQAREGGVGEFVCVLREV